METIKVNMSPNPLDVQTIHASQNDGEARQWGFELHNNGELIDTSDVKEQLFFKAYKGGTEQILPENTSTPTTSPFKGDIKYPQGLLSDQEFLYRESPTEEDGLAKITDIKGNTIVWNQVVQNGNFADSSLWAGQSTTILISNNIANVTLSAKGTFVALRQSVFASVTGHKYLVTATFKCTKKTAVGFYLNGQGAYLDGYDIQANTLTKVSALINGGESGGFNIYVSRKNELDVGDVVQVSNVMLFDLTKMGLDISNPSDFTSLFPLSYYSYNQGSLLSFNGNGIKTVGKNQLDPSVFNEVPSYTVNNDESLTVNSSDPRAWTAITTFHLKKGKYIFTRSVPNGVCDVRFEYEDFATNHLVANQLSSYPFTVTQDTNVKIKIGYSYSSYPFTTNVMIRFADTDNTFEPYTESTTNLPIATYFPTGMKSAGTVYDELTPTKAITRIGAVNLGSLTWLGGSWNGHYRYYASVTNIKTPQESYDDGLICSRLSPSRYPITGGSQQNNVIARYSGRVYVATSDYTSTSDFKTAMDGIYLYYELATPIETSFTTASLVTENGETPLSNEDGVLIGKCTEQLSENPGFIDAKIKLSDADGECYSNKIQLHVERSPQ